MLDCAVSSLEGAADKRALSSRQDGRRGKIIEIAADAFLRDGYANTSMSSIAAKVGGSKGTLWSYFSSREELLVAVIEYETRDSRARIASMLSPSTDVRCTLAEFGRCLLTRITSRRALSLHRLVVGESGRHPEIAEIFFQTVISKIYGMLAAYLQDCATRGVFSFQQSRRPARTLMTLLTGNSFQNLLMGLQQSVDDEEINSDVEHALDCFFNAYSPTT